MKIPILCFRRWRAITYGVRQLAAAFIGRCFASAQNCAPDSAFLHSDVAVRPPVRHTLNPAKQASRGQRGSKLPHAIIHCCPVIA